ncbi:hypothetical protein T492DRAFT_928994 [Pavlovales sp. CCMP2436]|nr:hypothetical protein T492DRAFT_928994 [Pavlovales sp. CCMP2436]|mmetsp:Transcript_35066/g.81101  ORF Transcript_35066/g.81101 Transcript_35066/m.81101 type:complete len:214 (+) Transcript_35066:160-801(+)
MEIKLDGRRRAAAPLELFRRAHEEADGGELTSAGESGHRQSVDTPHALRARGETHAEAGRWREALAAFNAALSAASPCSNHLSFDAAEVHELKAQTLLALGDDWGAARAATDATRTDELYVPGFHTLGRALRNMGELILALQQLERAEVLCGGRGANGDAAVEVAEDVSEAEKLLTVGFVLLAQRSGQMPERVEDAVRAFRTHAAGDDDPMQE